MSTSAWIGLGSNLGDRQAHLDAALAALAETPKATVRAVSAYRETVPIGGPPGQGAFLNAAAALETTLRPVELLERLHAIERQLGRLRLERWGERTIDLDLLLFGNQVLQPLPRGESTGQPDGVDLTVPHPWLPFRRFVLAPLAEIAPSVTDPLTGRTIADLLSRLDASPRYLALFDPGNRFSTPLCQSLIDLGMRCLRYAEAPKLSVMGPRRTDLESRSGSDCIDAFFDQLARDLSRERWRAAVSDDRWLVTDVWFDSLALGQAQPTGEWTGVGERLQGIRDQMIAPMFVVAPPGSRLVLSRRSREPRWLPPLGDTPILEIDPRDPSAMLAKVLAATEATSA